MRKASPPLLAKSNTPPARVFVLPSVGTPTTEIRTPLSGAPPLIENPSSQHGQALRYQCAWSNARLYRTRTFVQKGERSAEFGGGSTVERWRVRFGKHGSAIRLATILVARGLMGALFGGERPESSWQAANRSTNPSVRSVCRR